MALTQYANQASGVLAPSSTSTEGGQMAFGFPATRVTVQNDRATAVYVNFGSTVMSTGGYKTCSGEALTVEGIPISGLGLASTSTSTGTFVRVLALGA